MSLKYYRRDGTPYEGDERTVLFAWANDFEHTDRRVKQTHSIYGELISTVFLGLDHSFWGGPPLIFETMLFPRWGGEEYQERYSTEREALDGHEALEMIALGPPGLLRRCWEWLLTPDYEVFQ